MFHCIIVMTNYFINIIYLKILRQVVCIHESEVSTYRIGSNIRCGLVRSDYLIHY